MTSLSQATMSNFERFYHKVVEFAKNNSISVAITTIFLLALVLRAWGIKFGLPNLYHPDEWAIVDRSLAMMRTGDYNPREFGYPSLYMYMELVMLVLYFFYGVSKGLHANLSNIDIIGFYAWGRLLTALLGALTVYVTYLTGKRLFEARVGLFAALLLTLSFLHARDSHYITVDVPAVFFISLSLFFAARIIKTSKIFDYSMSGLFAGLAIATKWNAFPIVLSFVAAYILFSTRGKKWDGKVFYSFLFLAIGLFIGTPYAFLDLPTFLNTLGGVLFHYQKGHPGFEASKPYLFYLKHLASSEGVGFSICVTVAFGLILSLVRRKRESLLLLIFGIFYFLIISRSAVTFPRNTLPLYSVLPLYGGLFLGELFDFLKRRFKEKHEIIKYVVFSSILILIVVFPAVRIIQFDIASATIGSRTAAAEWIEKNLPKGSKIAAEFYAPPISGNFEVIKLPFLDYNENWFEEQGFDYIVFDGADYQRFFDEPEKYAKEIKLYKKLFRMGILIKRFPGDAKVEKFLSPEIKIYKLPREG